MYRQRLPDEQQGFTLLEVILALVILAGSIALLGEAMRLGSQSATTAARETHAQILAGGVMDQLLSGALELVEVSEQPLETGDRAPWTFTISFLPCDMEELRCVEVVVEQDTEPGLPPPQFRLVRYMPLDPSANSTFDDDAEDEADRDDSSDAAAGARNA